MSKETTEPNKLLCPKAGTATSSPAIKTPSPINLNIVNTLLWMKKNAYEETTIKATAKRLWMCWLMRLKKIATHVHQTFTGLHMRTIRQLE